MRIYNYYPIIAILLSLKKLTNINAGIIIAIIVYH